MSKRQHLVEQFHLVVKQEILNHNAQILATNQAIERIRQRMDAIEQGMTRELNSFREKLRDTDNRIEDCKSDISRLDHAIKRSCSAHERLSMRLDEKSTESDEGIQRACQDSKLLARRVEAMQKAVDDLTVMQTKRQNDLQQHVEHVCHKTVSEAKNAVRELAERPSEALQVKKDMQAELDSHKVNVAGVDKEIAVFREELDYEKKKVEELFNMFNRLKAKVAT